MVKYFLCILSFYMFAGCTHNYETINKWDKSGETLNMWLNAQKVPNIQQQQYIYGKNHLESEIGKENGDKKWSEKKDSKKDLLSQSLP